MSLGCIERPSCSSLHRRMVRPGRFAAGRGLHLTAPTCRDPKSPPAISNGKPGSGRAVVIAMRRALRSKLQRPRQALGLTHDLRDRLIRACPDTLMGKRDRAMIAIEIDTLCRRAELVGLRVEDLLGSRERAGRDNPYSTREKRPVRKWPVGVCFREHLQTPRRLVPCNEFVDGWIFRRVQAESGPRRS